MNCANVIVLSRPARSRKAARNGGEAAAFEELRDDPIYKPKRMHKVQTMLQRILTLAAGVLLGVALSATAVRVAVAWNLWPNRELNRSTDYFREVLQMVHENYVDAKSANYEQLSRTAIHGMVESLDPHSEFLEVKSNRE